MVKIKIRSGRGTKVIEVDSDATKWSGDEFKKFKNQEKKQQQIERSTLVEEQVQEN